MKSPKCGKCRQRPARIKLVRVVQGQAHNFHLCEQCAATFSPFLKKNLSLQDAIDKVLAQLVQKQTTEVGCDEECEGQNPQCPSCGTTYAHYQDSFLLGCAECYGTFETLLDPQLRRLHGDTQHVGSRPQDTGKSLTDIQDSVKRLEKELQVAVEQEDFEKAARLRDRIRHLRGELDHVLPEMPEM